MLDILRDYLVQTATPEMVSAIEDSHDLFDLFGLDTADQSFEEILMTDSQSDEGQTLIDIVELTTKLLKDILGQHGIVLVDEQIRLSTINTVVRAVHDIQNYEDKDTIVRASSIYASNEEVLAECLSLVCPLDVTDMLLVFETVDKGLIDRLTSISLEGFDDGVSQETQMGKLEKIKALKELGSMFNIQDLYVVKLLETGVDVGYHFDVYVNPNIESLEPARAACELLACAFVSQPTGESPRVAISQYLEQSLLDIDKVTAINVEINKLLLSLNQK